MVDALVVVALAGLVEVPVPDEVRVEAGVVGMDCVAAPTLNEPVEE